MGTSPLRRTAAGLSLAGFLIAGCVALALMAATQWLAAQQRRAAEWTLQGQEVLAVIADTRAALVDIQNGHRGFTIEGTQEALEPYVQGATAIGRHAARLRELLRDVPEQQVHLAQFERLLPARMESAVRIIEARRTGGLGAARQLVATGAAAREMAQLRSVLAAMDRQQEAVFRQRHQQQQAALSRLSAAAGVLAFLLLPALAVLYVLNRRRRAAQEALDSGEAARQRLQQLSARMVEHQEQERRRLAFELHEDMAQSMSAIRFDLERAQRGGDNGQAVSDAIRLLDALIGQTRDMVARLRPTMLDDLGLPEALEGELAQHARRNGWKVRLEVEPRRFPALPPQVATACFRIAQEALTNAAWHAQAQEVQVTLRMHASQLELAVEDDGIGFDADPHLAPDADAENFGLVFMRERARQIGGRIDIGRASGGRGATVSLTVPAGEWAPGSDLRPASP